MNEGIMRLPMTIFSVLAFLLCFSTAIAQERTDAQKVALATLTTIPQEKHGNKTPPEDFTQYDKAPEVVNKVEPEYPAIALKSGLEGGVYVQVWVDESGAVVESKVVRSTDKVFDQAARRAAEQWKFTPAENKGKPVAVWITIPFRFRLTASANDNSSKQRIFVGSLQSIAENIIHGNDLDIAKSSIAPDAYVIDGSQYENLYAVLHGESKACRVVEGPGAKIAFVKTHVNDDMTSALMVLKVISTDGKKVRYNSVSFERQTGGEWKITSWHVSG